MLNWEIYYYTGSLPLIKITSQEMSWENVPINGVIKIKITKGKYSHTILGMDYYWIDNYKYGLFNATGETAIKEEKIRRKNNHQEIKYSGLNPLCYNWENEHEYLGEIYPSNNVKILNGIMIPDNEARIIGLI